MDSSSYLKIEAINDVRLCAPSLSLISRKLSLTTHFITLKSDEKDFQLMVKSIDSLRFLESAAERRYTPLMQPGSTLALFTKDFHAYELTIPSFSEARALHQSLELLSNLESLSSHYPFSYEPDFPVPALISANHPTMLTELVVSGAWRTSRVNEDYSICPSYPSSVMVPSKIDDQILVESSKFRQGGRFPILIYYHKPRQTTLLIAAEPLNSMSSSNSSTSIISSGSGLVINSLAAAVVGSVASTNSPASKPTRNSLSSPSSYLNSQSSNRCRADELLLASVLPDRGRGAILDLRSQGEVKKLTTTGSTTESEQYYSQWRKIRRPMETAANLNTAFRKFIEACTNSGSYSKSSNAPFGPLQTGSLADPMNLLSTAASTPFATFVNENMMQSLKSLELQTNNPDTGSSNFNLNGLANDSAVSSSSSMDSLSSGLSLESPSNNNNSLLNQSTNFRRFAMWLSLVREALGAAVAGATALDARDAFAQQQLQQEQCLLAQKRKEEQLKRMRNQDSSNNQGTNGDGEASSKEEAKLRGSSLLIQSRGGRDRAILVAGLIQVILNPEARTIKGFQSLIDHTWIASGYPFSERCQNSAFGPKPGKSEAPFFVLFLDCVWQLLRQYPNAFEFTAEFLYILAKHAYFSEFGTFIGNSMQEREELEVDRQTVSLWAYVNQPSVMSHYRNVFYPGNDSSNEQLTDNYACWPCLAPQALDLWQELYQEQLIGDPDSIWNRPRQMARLVVDHFATEQARAIRLRKILTTLQEEAVKSKLFNTKLAQPS